MTLNHTIEDKNFEYEASLLLEDIPEVLDVFLRLTGRDELHLHTDPRDKTLKWDTWKVPGHADIATDAALRLLMDLDYVAEVVRLGKSDYLVRPSVRAMEVRSVFDRLPKPGHSSSPEPRPAAP